MFVMERAFCSIISTCSATGIKVHLVMTSHKTYQGTVCMWWKSTSTKVHKLTAK